MELIITEKQKSAQKVAEALGFYSAVNIGKQKLYVFQNSNTLIGHVSGHICTWNYAKKESWKDINFKKFIYTTPVEKYLSTYVQYFSKLFKDYNIEKLGIFTDKDTEGELIGFSICKLIRKLTKNDDLQVCRYTTSVLAKDAILSALNKTDKLDTLCAYSARAKHFIDLQWGATLTVLFTNYGKLFYSVGRVQTPTLALIVDRHNKIINHIPQTYYVINLHCGNIVFKSSALKNIDLEYIKRVRKIKSFKPLHDIKKNTSYPSKPLNATDLLKFSNVLYVDAKTCMSIGESLYLKGLISYPRSDSRYTTFEEIEKIYTYHTPEKYEPYIIMTGQKDSAHPPVMPTTNLPVDLTGLESKLYKLIYNHYLDILKGPYIYKLHTYSIQLEGIDYEFKNEEPIRQGYKDITYVPVNENICIDEVTHTQKSTKPPAPYTEGSIIKKMESLKIGTKSTRHTFLPLLRSSSRGYLTKFSPQKKALNLINVLNTYMPSIVDATLTRAIEEDLNDILVGKKLFDKVISKYSNILWAIVSKIESRKGLLVHELRQGIKPTYSFKVNTKKKKY